MSDDAQPALLEHLANRYANLKRSLVRVLGSDDLAGDALHDTYLRLQRQENRGPILSPSAYLLRMAVNIAVDIQRRQSRNLSTDDVEALMDLSDPAPGPAQVVEDRAELEALSRIMARLPTRRRGCQHAAARVTAREKEGLRCLCIGKGGAKRGVLRACGYRPFLMHGRINGDEARVAPRY